MSATYLIRDYFKIIFTYSNDYFSIFAKNDNEVWNKNFDFCMKSVKFTDNFTINKTT